MFNRLGGLAVDAVEYLFAGRYVALGGLAANGFSYLVDALGFDALNLYLAAKGEHQRITNDLVVFLPAGSSCFGLASI